jgi:hypothetical protein
MNRSCNGRATEHLVEFRSTPEPLGNRRMKTIAERLRFFYGPFIAHQLSRQFKPPISKKGK